MRSGRYLVAFARRGIDALGLDSSPEMVSLAQERLHAAECGFRVVATERNVAEARSAEIEELVLRLDELAPTE